eukprot:gene1792-2927_t
MKAVWPVGCLRPGPAKWGVSAPRLAALVLTAISALAVWHQSRSVKARPRAKATAEWSGHDAPSDHLRPYWKRTNAQSLAPPPLGSGGYLSFEPWNGGWNNRRMSLAPPTTCPTHPPIPSNHTEAALLLAHVTNRTLILPRRLETMNNGQFGNQGRGNKEVYVRTKGDGSVEYDSVMGCLPAPLPPASRGTTPSTGRPCRLACPPKPPCQLPAASFLADHVFEDFFDLDDM